MLGDVDGAHMQLEHLGMVCVCACARVCVCVCVCARARERERERQSERERGEILNHALISISVPRSALLAERKKRSRKETEGKEFYGANQFYETLHVHRLYVVKMSEERSVID